MSNSSTFSHLDKPRLTGRAQAFKIWSPALKPYKPTTRAGLWGPGTQGFRAWSLAWHITTQKTCDCTERPDAVLPVQPAVVAVSLRSTRMSTLNHWAHITDLNEKNISLHVLCWVSLQFEAKTDVIQKSNYQIFLFKTDLKYNIFHKGNILMMGSKLYQYICIHAKNNTAKFQETTVWHDYVDIVQTSAPYLVSSTSNVSSTRGPAPAQLSDGSHNQNLAEAWAGHVSQESQWYKWKANEGWVLKQEFWWATNDMPGPYDTLSAVDQFW